MTTPLRRRVSLLVCATLTVVIAFVRPHPTATLSAQPAATPPPVGSTHPFAIVGVTVIAMDAPGTRDHQTIVVRDGRIAALGPATTTIVPAGVTRIDGRGKFIVPGLAEMHAHVPGGNAADADIARVLELYALNGVTTARSMLGHTRHLAWKARAERGEILSPRIVTSGPSFNGTSVPSREAAIAMVESQKAEGFDFLKIHPGVANDVFTALAATADRVGIRFAGHVPLAVGLDRALDLKFETIDHVDGFVEALTPPGAALQATDSQWFGINLVAQADRSRLAGIVARTRAAGTWIVPTDALFVHGSSDVTPEQLAAWPEMRWVAPQQLSAWMENKRTFLAAHAPATRRAFLDLRREVILALHRGGVRMLLGSDAPQVWNVPGFATHRELEYMVAAGIPAWDALAMGTRNVAEFLKRSDTSGTLAVGKRADLLVLGGNPLADVTATRKIEGLAIGGRWITAAERTARLEALAVR